MPETNTISFPQAGMNYESDPLGVDQTSYRVGVNVKLDKQSLSQRDGVREVPLEGVSLEGLNFQGAVSYSPSRGQSALQFASKGDYIALSAAGRTFLIEVMGQGPNVYGRVEEVTQDAQRAPDLHMAWLAQAENYLVAGDDFGPTYLYDGVESASLSSGYNTISKDASRVPNRARLPYYTHGRLAMVVGPRSVLVGDSIHSDGKTDSGALLKFTDQRYLATGANFTLPTEAGSILAVYNLPTLGRSSDHGDFIVEAEDRVVAIRTGLYPRESWIDTPNMIATVSAEGGARGPWAYDVYTDDAVRRTTRGIETLSFSKRSSDLLYSPQELISQPLDSFFEGDYGPLLRFNSTKVHRRVKRLYTTVRPWVSGYHWKHRGVASFNYLRKAWEGVNVYPEPVKDVKCLVPLKMSGENRMFMIAGNDDGDGTIRLLEIEPDLRTDVLTDGEHPIRSMVETRAIASDIRESLAVDEGVVQFANVRKDTDWKVEWSKNNDDCWRDWSEGNVCVGPIRNADLGAFNGETVEGVRVKTARQFAFRVFWEGQADLRFHQVAVSKGPEDSNLTAEEDMCQPEQTCCSDFLTYK